MAGSAEPKGLWVFSTQSKPTPKSASKMNFKKRMVLLVSGKQINCLPQDRQQWPMLIILKPFIYTEWGVLQNLLSQNKILIKYLIA
jgi:hypothetical protein